MSDTTPSDEVWAIDLVALLPESVNRVAVELNTALRAKEPASFALDATHLPHITLVQQATRRSDLDAVLAIVAATLKSVPPLELRATGTDRLRTSAWLQIENTERLQGLHERLARALEPFAGTPLDESGFYVDGEAPREADIEWVRNYHRASSHEYFTPHVTLGVGEAPPLDGPIAFTLDRIAVCRLGRHCTCREVIREWRLATGS